MDIIKRNFIKLLCSGALKEYDPIEPMSNYKWDKLVKMGLSHDVMPQLNAGVKNNPYVPEAVPQSVVDDIVAACHTDTAAADAASSQLYNPLARYRLRKIRNEAKHDEDFSFATLQLLNIIVKNASETFSEGVSYSNLLPIAVFLRERGEQVDFVTLEKWLGKLFLRRFAQFIGSVLVLTLHFEQEEIPFLHSLDKNAYKVAAKAIDNCDEKKSHDWNVHQSSAGFVETNRKAMLQSVANCFRFFKYAPIEVVCNFIHCIITNISEIEE
jgi:hypothetical protein